MVRMIIDIPEEDYETVKMTDGCYYDFGKNLVKGTPILENATNGDVIKALFPYMRFQQSSVSGMILAADENNVAANTHYFLTWWDAPYLVGGEKNA